MNEIKDGGPAFPCRTNPRPGTLNEAPQRMALRDYFAAKVLSGLMANMTFPPATPIEHAKSREEMADSIATSCYRLADSMLRARGEA